MRIPSQFNEDSLYRRDRRRAGSTHAYRRLFRLTLGLVLVLVVMRQAARPNLYIPLFSPGPGGGDSPAPPTEQAAVSQLPWNGPSGSNQLDHPLSARQPTAIGERQPTAVDRRIAAALVAELRPSDQGQWWLVLSRRPRADRTPDDQASGAPATTTIPSTVESIRRRLASLDFVSEQQQQAWLQTFAALQRRDAATKGAQTDVLRPDDWRRITALLAALDDAAGSRVVDGSVWRGGDFDAFYRFLDQATSLDDRDVAEVGVLSLLQQPDVFRGRLVRVSGGVARAEHLDAAENVFGIDGYWQLWLRPNSGADRPILAIVPDVPVSIGSISDSGTLEQGPQVVVVGRFLKRLAYASAGGADLAPVVVGRLIQTRAVETTSAAPHDGDQGSRALLILLLSIGVGIGLAAIATWQTRAMGRRIRQLRAARQTDNSEFFDRLQPKNDDQQP